MSDGKNIYAEALLEKLRTPIVDGTQGWPILSDIGLLVVDLSHRVERLDEKIYGNGKTGLVDQVKEMGGSLNELITLMNTIKPTFEHLRMRKTDEKQDWFKVFLRYLADKVLPALIVSAVVSWVAFQFALAIFIKSKP